MNIIWHENPFVDSIYHVPAEMYKIEHNFSFRGVPSLHEHIILNQNCAVIRFLSLIAMLFAGNLPILSNHPLYRC